MGNLSNNLKGILWTIAYCAVVTVITIATRESTNDLNIYMVSLVVYSIAFAIGLAGHLSIKRKLPTTKNCKLYLLRSFFGVFSYLTFAYGLIHMDMADVAAIIFTAPLFGVIFAVIIFKEKATPVRILALLFGFAGAMIVIRPMGISFNIASIIVLMSALTYSGIHLAIKSLTKTDSHSTISFYTQFGMFMLSIPMAIIYWQTPTLEQIIWPTIVAIGWHVNLYCMSKSHHNTDAVVVMPFQFMRLIFVTIAGVLLFKEEVDIYTMVGSMIILTGAIVATKYEMKR